ncbi:dihydrodipicolinate reductase [Nocardia sp. NPDC059177]|uniref:dihydrodipicolinate reductase n=1 Tax=Nocardia sp. NPDC059177 TaxID=3346759 RepID=UPI00369FA69D
MEPDTLYRTAIRPNPRRYTVVVWSSGRLARHLAAAVGEHPGLDLLAVRTDPHPGAGPAAHGEDVTALRTTQDVLTLAPDCVLYMPRVFDADTVCRLLMAGINVITTRSDLHHPDSMERTLCARLESACWAGRASLHSTGVSPGFVTELMPITIGAVQRRVDTVTIEEYTDLTHSDPIAPLPDIAGFGTTCPGHVDQRALIRFQQSFGPSLRLVADGLGLSIDTIEVSGDYAVAARTTPTPSGPIPAGTVGAYRLSLVGGRAAMPRVVYRATWYRVPDLDPAWPLEHNGWRAGLAGDSGPVEISVRTPALDRSRAGLSPAHTAQHAARTIPALCTAPPGIRTSLDLPPSAVTTTG